MDEVLERLWNQKIAKTFQPSDETREAKNRVKELDDAGKLFGPKGNIRPANRKVVEGAYEALGRDLRKHLGLPQSKKFHVGGRVLH